MFFKKFDFFLNYLFYFWIYIHNCVYLKKKKQKNKCIFKSIEHCAFQNIFSLIHQHIKIIKKNIKKLI